MNASIEDAHLLFGRWMETSSALQIKLLSSSLIFQGVGVVLDFNPASLQIGGESWQFTIPLDQTDYSFSDPREIPIASVRESQAAKYEFGLALRLPNGDELALMELKPEELEAEPEED